MVIYFIATIISTNFPYFSCMLAPFSQILNHVYKYIMLFIIKLFIIFTRQVDDNPTNGPDKSTKKILVDESTSTGIANTAVGAPNKCWWGAQPLMWDAYMTCVF